MNNNTLKTTPTVKLIDLLEKASNEGSQSMVNMIAWELAYRIYVPNPEKSIGQLAQEFGYIDPDDEEKTLKLGR